MASASAFSDVRAAFLGKGSNARWWGLAGIAQFAIPFGVDQYQDTLYDVHHIQRPVGFADAVLSRRAEFLAGRYCAARALAEFGARTHVGVGEHRAPLWPAGMLGTISHTSCLAVALVGRRGTIDGLGVDVEDVPHDGMVEDVRQHVLVGQDEQRVRVSSLPFAVGATLAFSAKESLFKALYPHVGAYFGFDAARIVALDPDTQTIELALAHDLAPVRWRVGARVRASYRLLDARTVATAVVLGAEANGDC